MADSPISTLTLGKSLSLATRTAVRPKQRKSRRPVTSNMIDRLTATCRAGPLFDMRNLLCSSVSLWAAADAAKWRPEGSSK